MPTESTTTNFAFPYPTSANDGPNFATGIADLAAGIDTALALAESDYFQAGVLSGGLVANPAVSAAGLVTGTSVSSGTAYILLGTSRLVRNAIPTAAISATPTLPASGKFAIVGIDLVGTTWAGTAGVALSAKGTDQTTSLLALANPPATATGHLRIMDLSIQNSAGTYSLAASRDRRPWARGAYAVATGTGNGTDYTTGTSTTVSDLTTRVEVGSSGTLDVLFQGQVYNFTVSGGATIQVLCTIPAGTAGPTTVAANWKSAGTFIYPAVASASLAGLTAGSHLFQVSLRADAGGGASGGTAALLNSGVGPGNEPVLVIREPRRASASNGTS